MERGNIKNNNQTVGQSQRDQQSQHGGLNKRVVKMPDDKMGWVLRNHFSKSYPDKIYGFRGASYTMDSLFLNPQKITRISKDATNLYYILMDRLPSYREYPSRSKSIIFSNSMSDANSYAEDISGGKVYKVYPSNRAKIGVAKSFASYIEFPYLIRTFGVVRSAKGLEDIIVQSIVYCRVICLTDSVKNFVKNNISLQNKDNVKMFSSMIDEINKVYTVEYSKALGIFKNADATMRYLDESGKLIGKNYEIINKILTMSVRYENDIFPKNVMLVKTPMKRFIKLLENKNLMDLLNELYEPTKNNIKLMSVDEVQHFLNKNSNETYELWTDSLCYLETVRQNQLLKFLKTAFLS